MSEISSDCELCGLARTTRWYAQFWEPFAFTILDCDSCDTPMAVLGAHRAEVTEAERAAMTGALRHLAESLALGDPDDLYFDDKMRQIPDHYHVHLRRRPSWWPRPGSG